MTSEQQHSPVHSRHDEGPPSREPECLVPTSTESLRPASAGARLGYPSHPASLRAFAMTGTPEDNAEGRQDGGSDATAGRPPTSNTGVVNGESCSAGGYGWDWSSTTHEGRQGVVDDLLSALGARVALPGKGLQGWSSSVKGYDAEGYLLASVYFGGGREDVHVVSTSGAADAARRAVLGSEGSGARTARVDTRVDTLVPFADLRGVCESVAGHKARLTYMESHQGGESMGRTLYVGAPSSSVRVRVYEKWLEAPGEYLEGTNRVEVQLRPPSRAKEMVSGWAPAETFCASQLTRRLASELGTEVAHPGTLEKARATPDLEQTLASMGEQYGPSVERWLAVSGGDVDTVLGYLLERKVAS